MPYTMEDFERDYLKDHFARLSAEDRSEILKALSMEEQWEALVSPLTKSAMNSGNAWRTIDASSDSSKSIQRGGHIGGCIQARKSTRES